ncbi:aminopeptidase [Conexibacter woesei]|uniref:Leucyl aminopeptidase (Aminopeptidase T)-like protein n=1 Tax=Conexibacter woesei (strain DSM 14684 / CCUG 47730 / CIP 108061 / JCM 11494 / NBRC 100937 / ID131577) TaxID=469383 RepID=D3FCR7_CONWI|nr:aminopeptidase [Conexibacter woesei]ADB51429.1 Leucyl aminopeptidase (aminopeptidase T)-like protein [Conexibacter woesei DSM 14684]
MSDDLERALNTVMERCLDIRSGENVLVIGDPGSRELAQALRDAAARYGADAVLAMMDERENDGTEPPPPIAAALTACDVYLAPTSRSLSHTRARKASNDLGSRGATLPGATAEMIARVMSVDFAQMKERTLAVTQLLTDADAAHITCARGSDLRLDLSGRKGMADIGEMTRPGTFGNLPAGEGFIAPLSGSGRLVASSLAPLGISPEPVILTVEDGHLTAADGPLGPEFFERLSTHGPNGTNVAELGVGTNDAAILTGNILEDEKILGTVHVAFGASMGIGGTVSVPIHLDVVVLEPTLDVGSTRVLDAGRWVL